MRFGGFTDRGFGLIAVAGSKFDPALLPVPVNLSFRFNEPLAKPAIDAVRRARLISYVERGIVPPSAFRDPEKYHDERDESCIHLVLHRGNCLLGAIRCQFHRKTPKSGDPQPLFREMMQRSGVAETDIQHVQTLMESGTDLSHTYCETSGWLSNPDLRKNISLGMMLPAPVWGFGNNLSQFQGISTLRASNKAASVLAQLGGETIRHGDRVMRFDDPFYRGPVQLMRMHSEVYDPAIAMTVESCRLIISNGGILIK